MTKERMLIGVMSLKMAYDGFAYLGEDQKAEAALNFILAGCGFYILMKPEKALKLPILYEEPVEEPVVCEDIPPLQRPPLLEEVEVKDTKDNTKKTKPSSKNVKMEDDIKKVFDIFTNVDDVKEDVVK